jgi:hypothetical protein
VPAFDPVAAAYPNYVPPNATEVSRNLLPVGPMVAAYQAGKVDAEAEDLKSLAAIQDTETSTREV